MSGALEYLGTGEDPTTIGMLQRLVESQADAQKRYEPRGFVLDPSSNARWMPTSRCTSSAVGGRHGSALACSTPMLRPATLTGTQAAAMGDEKIASLERWDADVIGLEGELFLVLHLMVAGRLRWLEGADHSFHVLRRSGRTDAEVMEEIGAAAGRWLAGIS